jgi:hypothetical protein
MFTNGTQSILYSGAFQKREQHDKPAQLFQSEEAAHCGLPARNSRTREYWEVREGCVKGSLTDSREKELLWSDSELPIRFEPLAELSSVEERGQDIEDG